MRAERIGVDVGGTFTDLILVDEEEGRITVDKVPSTPDDPSRSVVEGVQALCAKAGVALADVDNLLHGTTVATNIVLTHSGAEAGMITTHGFRDIVHIARHKKPFNFSLQQELPWQSRPLVKRRHRLTVEERVTVPDGDVLVELDDAEVRERVRALKQAGVESVAICLLHSYLNPAHERRIKEIVLEEFPEAYLSVSHEVLPLYREFERFSTVALNAYVGPKVSRYVSRFDEALREIGFTREVQLMQSSGGMATVESARERPVNLLMSGPVAGLVGGIWAGRMAGHENVVTLDMGGTSADIGVAAGAQLRMRHLLDTKVGDYQAMVPMVDIDTIGAGGGSIAYVDAGGVFRVGPQSAGADPGPACYGRGGDQPTSTDAQLLLGRLRPDRGLLGGDMSLDVELATAAMQRVADRLGVLVEEAALGALQIQKFSMAQAIEVNSVRRGYDPREFTLVAAGGAGPLFACDLAVELEIPRVLVPPHPGITSATGLLATDLQHEFVATERHFLKSLDRERLGARLDELAAQATAQLERDGVPDDRRVVRRLADCRYVGQGYEVRFDIPSGELDDGWTARLAEAFHAAHEREYGHRFDAEIEIVNVRALGIGLIPELQWAELEGGDGDPVRAKTVEHEVVFDVEGKPVRRPTPFYDRELLRAGDRVEGPAVVEQYDSTTVIPPGFTAEIDRSGNIVIDCSRRGAHGAGGAAGDADPDARDRRRLRRDREGDGRRPVPDELLVDHPRVRGSRCRDLRSRGERAGRVGLDADVHGRDAEDRQGRDLAPRRGHPRRRRDPAQRSVPRRDPLPRRRDRGADLLRGRARRLLRRVCAPARHRRRLPGPRGRPRRQLVGGEHLPRGQALRSGRAPGQALAAHPREHADADLQPRRHRGDDRRLRAAKKRYLQLLERYGREPVLGAARDWIAYSERMLRQEIAKVPDGVYGPEEGWLDDDGRNRGDPATGEGEGGRRGGRADDRPHRIERRGADRLQLPVRGDDRLRDDVHRADDLPRRGRVSGVRPAERRDAAADQGGRAEGLDLQPELPPRVLRALLPGAARGRPRARARSRRSCPSRSPPATLRTSTSSPTPASTPRRRSTGSTSRWTRAPTAAAPRATASTPSTASSRTRGTTRSRSSSGASPCGPSATSCATSRARRGAPGAGSAWCA